MSHSKSTYYSFIQSIFRKINQVILYPMSLSNSRTSKHFSNQSLEKMKQVIIYPINLSNIQPSNHLFNESLEQPTY